MNTLAFWMPASRSVSRLVMLPLTTKQSKDWALATARESLSTTTRSYFSFAMALANAMPTRPAPPMITRMLGSSSHNASAYFFTLYDPPFSSTASNVSKLRRRSIASPCPYDMLRTGW